VEAAVIIIAWSIFLSLVRDADVSPLWWILPVGLLMVIGFYFWLQKRSPEKDLFMNAMGMAVIIAIVFLPIWLSWILLDKVEPGALSTMYMWVPLLLGAAGLSIVAVPALSTEVYYRASDALATKS
jgi:hypothetical protein